jgi:hypothetical protein
MAATSEGTIITDGKGNYQILKGGQFQPYKGSVPGGTANDPFKVGDTDAISHAWDVVDSIAAARGLSQKPLAAGMPAEAVTELPVVGKLMGQNRANLQTKLGQVAGDLRQLAIHNLYQSTGQKGVGSIARSTSEQTALQNSMAALGYVDQGGGHLAATGPQPDAATLGQGLDTAQSIYERHLARLYGLNPDNPATTALLRAAIADPSKRAALLSQTVDSSTAPTDLSSNEQARVNPLVEKIKPQLTQMLDAPKSQVSNADIEAFVSKNGLDPKTWTSLQEGLAKRDKTQFAVDPRFNEQIKSPIGKGLAEVATANPGGIPIGASVVGAGDAYTLGAIPDIAGIVHGVTGVGPTRQDVVTARDISSAEHPVATFGGNMAGAIANPLVRGGGVARSALLSAIYGGLSSDDPSVGSRLINAAIGGTTGAATHGIVKSGFKGGQATTRALKNFFSPEGYADSNALARAAAAMPKQDLAAVETAIQPGVPAAAAVDRAGQEFLSRVASSAPGARTAADAAASTFRKAIPSGLEADFNQAIADAAPAGAEHTAAFLNRPVRDITNDVQNMASREYELGMDPIKNDTVPIDDDLAEVLSHEQIKPVIADLLRNQKLAPETRAVLRSVPSWLKDGMLDKLPINVDALRNIATNLDQRANKSNNIALGDLANVIRDKITQQFPEYQSVNELYSSRKGAIRAMDAVRNNFLGEDPNQIDELAKATGNLTDTPNLPEYKGPAFSSSGPVLPSGRQFAMAGAREAASTKAGSGTGTGGANLLRQIAEGANQQARNAMAMGTDAGTALASKAGTRANVADAIERVASGPAQDQTANWFKLGKYALTTKLTGGSSHYAAARALIGVPKLSSDDAARVVNIYLNADSADQVLKSLKRSYGAATARDIMGRLAALGTAGRAVRNTPVPASPVIGSPIVLSGGPQ